jgi:integrator complex subunit 11
VLSGEKQLQLDKATTINVQLQVKSLSFSAHADAKGIVQLISQCQPKSVVLVHGEPSKMYVIQYATKEYVDDVCMF